MDNTKDEQFAPEFLKISPNNRIPTIVDGDQSIFVSGAILIHLTEKTGLFAPVYGSSEYWQMMQWLM